MDIPKDIIERTKTINESAVTVDELFIVAKALEKSIESEKVFTKEDIELIGKPWNKVLCYCEKFFREKKLNELTKDTISEEKDD